MTKPLWIIQNNLIPESVFQQASAACEKYDIPYQEYKIIPFDDKPITVDYDGPVIAYGSTTMIQSVKKSDLVPGVFFDPDQFRPSLWNEKLSEYMLNADAITIKIADIADSDLPETFFVRPNDDMKDFGGDVMDKEIIANFAHNVSAGGYLFDDSLLVSVSTPKNTGWEWRIFMVDGKAISASAYRIKRMYKPKAGAPREVLDFVEKVNNIWAPNKHAYVVDVCESNDGLKIIEFNCLSASGVYECDVDKIVRSLSIYVEEVFNG